MRTSALRTVPQRSLVWLLWLALLLPIAQATAAWHAMSHAVTDASADAEGKRALHTSASCDLCLSAAALSGGALPSVASAMPLALARHVVPQAAFSGLWLATSALAYQSRAPPASTH